MAIKKMHEGGMAHGDLHLGNILKGGQVVDWGATRPLNAMRLYEDYERFIIALSWLPHTFEKQFRDELARWYAELIKAMDGNQQRSKSLKIKLNKIQHRSMQIGG